jgi:hypothetical protein
MWWCCKLPRLWGELLQQFDWQGETPALGSRRASLVLSPGAAIWGSCVHHSLGHRKVSMAPQQYFCPLNPQQQRGARNGLYKYDFAVLKYLILKMPLYTLTKKIYLKLTMIRYLQITLTNCENCSMLVLLWFSVKERLQGGARHQWLPPAIPATWEDYC